MNEEPEDSQQVQEQINKMNEDSRNELKWCYQNKGQTQYYPTYLFVTQPNLTRKFHIRMRRAMTKWLMS